ncbi:MAG: hypothetical protein M3Y72_15380 [Acidobacteriota bacterium]|nr:hypothetical protein [Acidobacteriota bacterium]
MAELLNHPVLLFAVVAISLAVLVEAGFRFGRARGLATQDVLHEQVKDARDGLTLLLSLLLGFTLAMSMPRYDERKHLLLDEANDIGTALLRARLLPAPYSERIEGLLKRYAAMRLADFETGDAGVPGTTAMLRTKELQGELWQATTVAARAAPTPVTAIFIQSLNDTIDISEKQIATLENRIPRSVWLMIALIAGLAAFVSGLAVRRRFLLNMILMPLMVAVVMSLTADLDSPRTGLIRVGLGSLQRLNFGFEAAPILDQLNSNK